MIARFSLIEFHLIWSPTALRFFLAGLIDFLQTTPRERRRERITRMSTMLTELMQQLQDVHTHHLGDGRVIVAVPTTPHTVEQFEVGEVHHDGPSVVLYCQPLQDEQARHQDEQARPQDEQASPPAKKPGLASITTTRICSDEFRRAWLRTATGSFSVGPCESPTHRSDCWRCRLIVLVHQASPLARRSTPNLRTQ